MRLHRAAGVCQPIFRNIAKRPDGVLHLLREGRAGRSNHFARLCQRRDDLACFFHQTRCIGGEGRKIDRERSSGRRCLAWGFRPFFCFGVWFGLGGRVAIRLGLLQACGLGLARLCCVAQRGRPFRLPDVRVGDSSRCQKRVRGAIGRSMCRIGEWPLRADLRGAAALRAARPARAVAYQRPPLTFFGGFAGPFRALAVHRVHPHGMCSARRAAARAAVPFPT